MTRLPSSLLASVLAVAAITALAPTPGAAQSDCPMTDVFERLVCEQELADRRLRLDQTNAKRREVATASGDGPLDAGAFPSLIRVYGQAGALTAQFDAAGAPITVRVGEVVAGWRVIDISRNAVVLDRNGDRRAASMTNGVTSPPPLPSRAVAPTPPALAAPPATPPTPAQPG